MKKTILIALIFLVFIGCTKNSTQPEPPAEFWDNATEMTDIIPIADSDFSRKICYCINTDKIKENNILRFDDSISYAQFLHSIEYNELNCPVIFPSLDFSKQTLLGRYVMGLDLLFTQKLYINDVLHRYHYRIHVLLENTHLPRVFYLNLLIVPKLKPGYILTSDTVLQNPFK
jgi:hypothetical protein